MNTSTEVRLEDLFHELSMAKPATSVDLLDELVRTYPRYASELTDFAVELAFDEVRRTDSTAASPVEETDPMVARAMSKLHNRIFEVRNKVAVNPFSSMSQDKIRSIGKALNANTLFVLKLRDRRIRPETISVGFRRHIANLVGVSEAVMAAHHSAPSVIQQENRFKSDQKPEAGKQESFEEALASAGLTEEQQRYLSSL